MNDNCIIPLLAELISYSKKENYNAQDSYILKILEN